MTQLTFLKPAAIMRLKQANALGEYMFPARLSSRLRAPHPASPASGTLYVAASDAAVLPAGNDTTGTGTAAAPYATLTKALSKVPAAGDYTIAADGTFAENTSGRFILAGDFTLPVVIVPHSGASVTITNADGTNGVINVRSARANNIQFSGITIQPSTDGCPTIWMNPLRSAASASNLLFHDCTIVQRSGASHLDAIRLENDYAVSGLWFVGCRFQRVTGAAQTCNPTIISTRNTTTQCHARIGVWDCETTDAQWSAFSSRLSGITGLTLARNTIRTSLNHALLVGVDSSGTDTPPVSDLLVYENDLMAHGPNPHGLEIGDNVTGIVAMNSVTSGLQGIVVKGARDVRVVQNTVCLIPTGVGHGTALYAKASSGTIFDGNNVMIEDTGYAATAFREAADSASPVQVSATTLRNNFIELRGPALRALAWADGSESTGGAASDGNMFALHDGAVLGSVRGETVTTLAELQAAWTSHGLAGDRATNDAESSLDSY